MPAVRPVLRPLQPARRPCLLQDRRKSCSVVGSIRPKSFRRSHLDLRPVERNRAVLAGPPPIPGRCRTRRCSTNGRKSRTRAPRQPTVEVQARDPFSAAGRATMLPNGTVPSARRRLPCCPTNAIESIPNRISLGRMPERDQQKDSCPKWAVPFAISLTITAVTIREENDPA